MNEFIEKLLKLIAKYEIHGEVLWHTDLKFFALCNDIFWWAVSDGEAITTDEDLELLEKSLNDSEVHGVLLYCCRKREMRPQGAVYKILKESEYSLFDACGPERDIDFFNPQDQNGEYKYKE